MTRWLRQQTLAAAALMAACVALTSASTSTSTSTSASSASCSGHGLVFAEEAGLPGGSACQCFQCYTGTKCQTLVEDCAIETRVAEATLFLEWFEGQKDLDITVGPTYHLGYLQSPRVFPPGSKPSDPGYDNISKLLNASIHGLHSSVGNIKDQHKYNLVVGAGGVQLIDAALYALTQGPNQNKSMQVIAQAPYYPHFEMASNVNPLTNFTNDIDGACRHPERVIEIVTSPNNPDGRWLRPKCPKAFQITDYVYNWPHYAAADPTPKSDDIMIFSLSKLCGYAASRIGWAFVRDSKVASIMSHYMWLQSTAPAVESQLRAVKILNAITTSMSKQQHGQAESEVERPRDAAAPSSLVQQEQSKQGFFPWAQSVLNERWMALTTLFSTQSRFSLNCTHGNLFMWIRCMDKDDAKDCALPFVEAGIMTETGVSYGAGTDTVRICMGHYNSTFELLYDRLAKLFKSSHGAARHTSKPSSAAPSGMEATSSIGDSDIERAERVRPSSDYLGTDFTTMTKQLNRHLYKFSKYGVFLRPCSNFTLRQLHDVSTLLHDARDRRLDDIYRKTSDPRHLAFGQPHLSFEKNKDLESSLARTSPVAASLIHDALCHRIVMQYAHHVTDHVKRNGALGPVNMPLLPSSYNSYARLTDAVKRRLDEESLRRHVRSAAELQQPLYQPDNDQDDGGDEAVVSALQQAQQLYDDATKCIVCHVDSGSTPSTSSGSADSERPSKTPITTPKPPFVPPWPDEFDVKFGLTTKELKNVSSHMYFSYTLPAMRVHHSRCHKGFLPSLPDIDGPCNLTFHGNGLWFTWFEDPKTRKEGCCNVVLANLTLNLGVDELGGFIYKGNETTTDYYGQKVEAEVWTNGPRLQPPSGFKIFIDPASYEDVHYHNGGPYFLEWALGHRNVHGQQRADFEIDAANCDRKCENTIAGSSAYHEGTADADRHHRHKSYASVLQSVLSRLSIG